MVQELSSQARRAASAPAGRARRRPRREAGPLARRVGYVISIIVNAAMIVVARAIPGWGLPFVTPAYGEVLPAIVRSLAATILAYAVLCAYDPRWCQHLARVVMNAFALNATLVMAHVFPFDFGSPRGDNLARIVLLLLCVALVIATFVEAVKMLLALADRGGRAEDVG